MRDGRKGENLTRKFIPGTVMQHLLGAYYLLRAEVRGMNGCKCVRERVWGDNKPTDPTLW